MSSSLLQFRMWKLFALIVMFCVSFSEQYTYTAIQNHKLPGRKPFCISKIEGKKKVGESWFDLERCESLHCGSDSEGKAYISGSGCASVGGPPNCKVVKPIGAKSYPECCPRLECGQI